MNPGLSSNLMVFLEWSRRIGNYEWNSRYISQKFFSNFRQKNHYLLPLKNTVFSNPCQYPSRPTTNFLFQRMKAKVFTVRTYLCPHDLNQIFCQYFEWETNSLRMRQSKNQSNLPITLCIVIYPESTWVIGWIEKRKSKTSLNSLLNVLNFFKLFATIDENYPWQKSLCFAFQMKSFTTLKAFSFLCFSDYQCSLLINVFVDWFQTNFWLWFSFFKNNFPTLRMQQKCFRTICSTKFLSSKKLLPQKKNSFKFKFIFIVVSTTFSWK